MTNTKLLQQIQELNELETLLEEIKREAETIKDSIKDEMSSRGLDQMEVGDYVIRWTEVLSNRFDTTEFKKQYAEVYKKYTKQIVSKRFSISY